MSGPIRVVVVDDSAFYRGLLERILSSDPELEVVATASDPYDAREKIKQFNPDVITLDVEMPNMDGVSFLERIMRLRPMPVIMVSTLTQEGADVTLKALELGAVDFHAKPTSFSPSEFEAGADVLCEKVRVAAKARVRSPQTAPASAQPKPGAPATAAAPVADPNYNPGKNLVAIGSSTGGVEALLEVLSTFPANCAPTLITQHMPAAFTASFAKRLDRSVQPNVAEATDGALLKVGQIYVAPGGACHLEVAQGPNGFECRVKEGDLVSGHRPSVDVLFRSFTNLAKRTIGVILTGMGRDGAAGMKELSDAGARTLGQDEQSCVVYGMPRVAHELGGVQRQLPLRKIGPAIVALAGGKSGVGEV